MATSPTSPLRPRRRWYQYSLRSLFVLTLLFSLCMSWFATRMRRARNQHEVVAAITELGYEIRYDYQIDASGQEISGARPWTPEWLRKPLGDDFFVDVVSIKSTWPPFSFFNGVSRSGGYIADDHLAKISCLTNLRILSPGYGVTDAGLSHLAALTQLEALDLRHSRVSNAGLAQLATMTRLQELNLRDLPITDDGLAFVARLGSLKKLNLEGTKVTDTGLTHLRVLSQLRSLSLAQTPITDQGLVQLRSLALLTDLDLYKTKISDVGLSQLREMTQLESLELGYTNVSDAGLANVTNLKNLESLVVAYTKVTGAGLKLLEDLPHLKKLRVSDESEGLRKFRKAIPTCTVLVCDKSSPVPNTK